MADTGRRGVLPLGSSPGACSGPGLPVRVTVERLVRRRNLTKVDTQLRSRLAIIDNYSTRSEFNGHEEGHHAQHFSGS